MDITLATIAEELNKLGIPTNPIVKAEQVPQVIDDYLEIPLRDGAELVLSQMSDGVLEGPEPHIDISHHIDEGGGHAASHILVTLAQVSGNLAVETAKAAYEYYRDQPKTQQEREQELFSELVGLRLRHSQDPNRRGYQDGMASAFIALTGVDPERLHDEIEEAAQAAHEKMLAETENF